MSRVGLSSGRDVIGFARTYDRGARIAIQRATVRARISDVLLGFVY
jgi:hypothetical protein